MVRLKSFCLNLLLSKIAVANSDNRTIADNFSFAESVPLLANHLFFNAIDHTHIFFQFRYELGLVRVGWIKVGLGGVEQY